MPSTQTRPTDAHAGGKTGSWAGERADEREGQADERRETSGWASRREGERETRGKAAGGPRVQSADEHYTHGDRERAGRMPSTQARPTNRRRA
ncbi:uncharacterized protein B0H18DRAFT_1062179, partial [Fomitopsis serialis]|uniref:uncharacterized protein n=1 Tax=Fomitopsis serialis TaxID=139415 RepID=UPI0020089F83